MTTPDFPHPLRRMANDGEIRGAKFKGKWVFDTRDLDAYLDEHENRPQAPALRRQRDRRSA